MRSQRLENTCPTLWIPGADSPSSAAGGRAAPRADEWCCATAHELLLEHEWMRTQAAKAAADLCQMERDRHVLGALLKKDAEELSAVTEHVMALVALSKREMDSLDRFAAWIADSGVLLGLLRRWQAPAVAKIAEAMRDCGVPERCDLSAELARKRFLLGLLRHRMLGGSETARAIVFLRLARAAMRGAGPPAAVEAADSRR